MSRPAKAVKAFVSRLTAAQLGLARKTVSLSPPHPAWAEAFEWVAAQLRSTLSQPCVINHVGSTSIPGLCAKPVLDILVVFSAPQAQLAAIEPLVRLGFVHKGDGVARVEGSPPDPGRHFYSYYDLDMAIDFVHLHTYVTGHSDISRLLAFRDRLRKDAGERERYGALKQALFREGKIRREYTLAKGAFIAGIADSSP